MEDNNMNALKSLEKEVVGLVKYMGDLREKGTIRDYNIAARSLREIADSMERIRTL